jgi:tyrosine-protein phosphatase SIW14
MAKCLPWMAGGVLALFLIAVPFIYYRYEYTYGKRLRVVERGRVYRSGQMTAPGFRAALRRLGIKTVLNVQDDVPDPKLWKGYFTRQTIHESELCKEMGVRFVCIGPDLIDRRLLPVERPRAIDDFLELMDNPANYPVLIHCKAGLHRTGCLVAVYRMEYDHWSMTDALRELKAHGFGEFVSTRDNDYIAQYLVNYKPGVRRRQALARHP